MRKPMETLLYSVKQTIYEFLSKIRSLAEIDQINEKTFQQASSKIKVRSEAIEEELKQTDATTRRIHNAFLKRRLLKCLLPQHCYRHLRW